jgi:hypothetical protein
MVNVIDRCCCQPDEINRKVFNLCELKKILVPLVMDKRAAIAKEFQRVGVIWSLLKGARKARIIYPTHVRLKFYSIKT